MCQQRAAIGWEKDGIDQERAAIDWEKDDIWIGGCCYRLGEG